MTKDKQGKWVWRYKNGYIKEGQFTIADLRYAKCSMAKKSLLAAAPELYEALQAWVNTSVCICYANEGTQCHHCVSKAALSKARGEE